MFGDDTEVDEDIAIRDIRSIKDFAGITFEGHRLNDVKKAMLSAMKEKREEETMNWMIELLCSKHEKDIWEVLCKYYGRYLRSEKVLRYITHRRDRYEEKTRDKSDIRNDTEMRYIFMEMCMVLMEKEKYERKRYKVKLTESTPPSIQDMCQRLRELIERRSERESKEVVEDVILYSKSEIERMECALDMTDSEKMIQRLSKEYFIYYELIERRVRTTAPIEESLLIHKDKFIAMEERIKYLYIDKKHKEIVRRTVL
jgi:hypothetical protein